MTLKKEVYEMPFPPKKDNPFEKAPKFGKKDEGDKKAMKETAKRRIKGEAKLPKKGDLKKEVAEKCKMCKSADCDCSKSPGEKMGNLKSKLLEAKKANDEKKSKY